MCLCVCLYTYIFVFSDPSLLDTVPQVLIKRYKFKPEVQAVIETYFFFFLWLQIKVALTDIYQQKTHQPITFNVLSLFGHLIVNPS